MTKFSFIVVLFTTLFCSEIVKAQNVFNTGVYCTKYNTDTKNASNFGVGFSFNVFGVHIDFSSNYAKGKGEFLDYSSSYTTRANKKNVQVFNVGYSFSYKKFKITPIIGIGYISNIYEDPVLFDSYYLGDKITKYNYGLILSYSVSKYLDISLGGGAFELAKVGLNFKLF